MRCEEYLSMVNELLNKTLAPVEKKEVEAHLAVCEDCRAEFQRLKKADDLLRETICDMFSEIGVPSDLSGRIEEVLKKEREKPARLAHSKWLPAFLRVPAVAAALLLFIAAGTFGYRYIFTPPLKQSEIVMQEPAVSGESEPLIASDDSGSPAGSVHSPKTFGTADVQEKSAPLELRDTPPAPKSEGNRNLISESEAERLTRESAPPGKGGEPEPGSAPEKRGGADVQKNAGQAADSALPEETQQVGPQAQEDMLLFAAGAPSTAAEDEEIQDSEKDGFAHGALEDTAEEIGFVCLEPDYLPPGAELRDLTRVPGAVYQNYRVGQLSLQISQSLAGASKININSESRETAEIEINGARGILEVKEPGDENGTSPVYTTITWQQGELLISIGGELPREELVKIASSLK